MRPAQYYAGFLEIKAKKAWRGECFNEAGAILRRIFSRLNPSLVGVIGFNEAGAILRRIYQGAHDGRAGTTGFNEAGAILRRISYARAYSIA